MMCKLAVVKVYRRCNVGEIRDLNLHLVMKSLDTEVDMVGGVVFMWVTDLQIQGVTLNRHFSIRHSWLWELCFFHFWFHAMRKHTVNVIRVSWTVTWPAKTNLFRQQAHSCSEDTRSDDSKDSPNFRYIQSWWTNCEIGTAMALFQTTKVASLQVLYYTGLV